MTNMMQIYDKWKDREARDEGIDLETYDYSERMKCYGLDKKDMNDVIGGDTIWVL